MSPEKLKPWIRVISEEERDATQSELSDSHENDDV